MKPFLKQVAEEALRLLSDRATHPMVVLPSHRAGVFLRGHLASLIEKPVWAPELLPIEDFVFRCTGLRKSDPVKLLFDLYHLHCAIAGDEARLPDDFFPIGEMMLADFDQADHHLTDTSALFNYLHEARALDLWNADGSALTALQQRYLSFYASLSAYYSRLREMELHSGQAWQGLATRLLNDTPAGNWKLPQGTTILFAGFNALTPAEEAMMSKACRELHASVLWDTDAWYLDREEHEAGLFLRRYREKGLPAPLGKPGNGLASNPRTIHIIGVPLQVAQAKEAGRILSEEPFTREPGWQSRTAVIPADEALLLPLLNAIPAQVGKYNVTMGIPLRLTPAGSLAALWLDAMAGARGDHDKGSWHLYLSDFIRVANHPLMVWAYSTLPAIVNQLQQQGRLFISWQEVHHLLGISQSATEGGQPVDRLAIALLSEITRAVAAATMSASPDPFASASVAALSALLPEVEALMTTLGAKASLTTLRRLMNQLAGSVKIPFGGEPLTGIQVMGMLETRSLDFENLILLGMNDDVVPGSGQNPSFIPADIRTETFGMAGFREKNAVMAYHFYRLLQRARNVYLLYNNVPGHLGKGEPSRFLLQIRYEFPGSLTHTVVKEYQRVSLPEVSPPEPIVVEKSDVVMQQLAEAARRGFSPSTLSLLVECPLRFFLTVVEGVRPPKEFDISIESDVFGDVVHHVAETVFRPLLGRQLDSEWHSPGREAIVSMLSAWFEANRPDLDYRSGNNLLVFNVATDYLLHFFDTEHRMAALHRVRVMEIEKPLHREMSVSTSDGDYPVVFRGRADRIDLRDDLPVVIDYKTGTVDPRAFTITEMDLLVTQPRHAKALQLMTYAWLSAGSSWFKPPFRCAIWPLRAPSKALIPLMFDTGTAGIANSADDLIGVAHLHEFEEKLRQLLESLFDKAVPFSQTPDYDNCRYCPFAEMCNRLRPAR